MFSPCDRGSISCLPILETINSDISEFIATNIISITDGQLFINRSLFHLAIRPSVDSSLSVSRIGSSAQSSLISHLAAGLKNALTITRQSLSNSTSLHINPITVHPSTDYHSADDLL
jgi:F0F1-type ATP synthase alpha subunit